MNTAACRPVGTGLQIAFAAARSAGAAAPYKRNDGITFGAAIVITIKRLEVVSIE